MTFPIDIHIGHITIASHAVFELLAFFVGYQYFLFVSSHERNSPLTDQHEWVLIVGVTIGAFVGSRLIAALENPYMFLHPPTWLYYIGSQTIAGGIGGGIIGVEIAKKIIGLKKKTGDIFVFPLMFSVVIGRIGCFLKGVSDGTVGLPSNLPWALDQGDGIPRHPTSLYEIVWIGIIWFLLKKLQKKEILKEGDLFSVFVALYLSFRFFVEFIKPREVLYIGLSSIQLLSLGFVLYYVYYFFKRYRTHAA